MLRAPLLLVPDLDLQDACTYRPFARVLHPIDLAGGDHHGDRYAGWRVKSMHPLRIPCDEPAKIIDLGAHSSRQVRWKTVQFSRLQLTGIGRDSEEICLCLVHVGSIEVDKTRDVLRVVACIRADGQPAKGVPTSTNGGVTLIAARSARSEEPTWASVYGSPSNSDRPMPRRS